MDPLIAAEGGVVAAEVQHRAGAARVILLSDRLWRQRYHGDSGVLGRQILDRLQPR